ncbi:hypothetical protein C0Q70_01017 [Pomacea canaliculata]|uniref:WD repeat-containing protein on Y chromosome n=1 Tax=Pomacea canaliculata TaxID=400727 RepID=A0A2T7PYA1_POMCA|nr:hypothetical protein C0Q70_01017 [Pomacea canaliculata]
MRGLPPSSLRAMKGGFGWSLHNKGGLLGQFAATEQVGEMVLAMTTDPQNELLITGDTRGYVRVWDLLLYCNREAESISETELEARDDAFHKKFLFLRAHAFPITCITYVADRELIITGDQGKAVGEEYLPAQEQVRIWLLSGRYIGTCGEPWQSLISPQQKMVQLRHLPSELRHCLSARTFKVIQVGAKHLLWDKAIRLVKQHLRGRQYKEKVTGKEKKEEKTKSSESLDQEWRNPRRSSILGSTYKPNLHYKPRPAIFTQNNIKKWTGYKASLALSMDRKKSRNVQVESSMEIISRKQ